MTALKRKATGAVRAPDSVRLSAELLSAPRHSLRRDSVVSKSPIRWWVFCCLALGACDAARFSRSGILTRTDSAGIQIVTVSPPHSDQLAGETATPHTVSIGWGADSDGVLLYDVQGAVTLSSGTVVVANGGSYQLRYYGSDGRFVRAVGRKGDGPGEFRFPHYLARLLGDSILVYDRGHQRVSVFDSAGRFAKSWSTIVPNAPLYQDAAGVTTNGDLVLRAFVGANPESAGPYLTPQVIGVFRRAESQYARIDTINGSEMAQVERAGRRVPAIRPFGRKSDVVAAGDFIFALDAEAGGEIRVYAVDGGLVRLIRVEQEPTPVTEERRAAWVKSFFDAISFADERLAEMWHYGFDHVSAPATIPVFRSLAPALDGGVCAERYGLLESTPPEYWCYSPDGTPTRVIRLPNGMKRSGFPHQDYQVRVEHDRTLVLLKDSLDVEHVRAYMLQRRQ